MEPDQQTQFQVKAAHLTKVFRNKPKPLYYMESQMQGWEMNLNSTCTHAAIQLIILSDKIWLQNIYYHTDANERKYTTCSLQITGWV